MFGVQNLIAGLLMMTPLNHHYLQTADALGWLAGTWTLNTDRGMLVEKWIVLNDSTVIGRSVLVKAEKDTILQESLRLSNQNGAWHFTSTVEGQNNNRPVTFKLVFLKGTEFICENTKHDFPQRIAYRRIGDALFASIEGKKGGYVRKVNFDFIKVKVDE
jgi:hypothetical protein